MSTVTVAKTKKVADLQPPRAIRENTKARRAWLADVAAWHADEGFTSKTLNIGSYQSLGVYVTTDVTARVQVRGTCSFCGRQQAVEGDRIVLHGYSRPGHGFIEGDCAGTRVVCAEKSPEPAKNFRASMIAQADRMQDEWTALMDGEFAAGNARDALYPRGFPLELTRTASKETIRQERTLRQTITALRDHAGYIADYVMPKFGDALKEVLV